MAVKTAIFIDFDNFHSNLEKLNPRAAERFADDPASWLEWFRLGRHAPAPAPAPADARAGAPADATADAPTDAPTDAPMDARADAPTDARPAAPRRLLLRRCYLNPDKFRRHRAGFVRAGFTVHDCPPLTTRGKNAADLWMTIDILDAIAHPTGFEEFIILASDADFTPVLLRLREHDRRTVLINDKLMAAALRAACDVVVPQDRFMAEALGLPAEAPVEAATEPPAPAAMAVPAAAAPARQRAHPGGMRADRLARALAGQAPDLIELATRLHAAIGLPALSPVQYRAAFGAMADAISESGEFDLIGRTVDRCRAAGVDVINRPVSDIREMLRGAGFDFSAGPVTGADLTAAFHACVLALCQQEGVTLGAPERALLDDWLGVGLVPVG